jgi:hypothetical protein
MRSRFPNINVTLNNRVLQLPVISEKLITLQVHSKNTNIFIFIAQKNQHLFAALLYFNYDLMTIKSSKKAISSNLPEHFADKNKHRQIPCVESVELYYIYYTVRMIARLHIYLL